LCLWPPASVSLPLAGESQGGGYDSPVQVSEHRAQHQHHWLTPTDLRKRELGPRVKREDDSGWGGVWSTYTDVIPAKAGIHLSARTGCKMYPCFRRDDSEGCK